MKIDRILRKIFLAILFLVLIFWVYFFVGNPPQPEKYIFGVDFHQEHSQLLGLDWKENYLALLDDLKVRNFKIAGQWDLIEKEKDKYDFSDLDWQIEEVEKRGGSIILIIGMKTGRWPECHIPNWAKGLPKEDLEKEILEILKEIVLRYQNSKTVLMWQVENEPLFPFGECPFADKKFLAKEIKLVKELDSLKRPIIISDSGEGSFWLNAGYLGDIVGTTMYKKVWVSQLKFYLNYPFPPIFYWRKARIIDLLFKKKVMVIELQAEPWGPKLLYDIPLAEQEKTMNLERFKSNIEFAKKTGFDTIYLWGGEWWFWLKEKQERPEIWEEARKLFVNQ